MGKRNRMAWMILLMTSLMVSLSVFPMTKTYAAEPVKIGLLADLSGGFTALGQDMRDGFLFYMDRIGYKAAGRTIEVIVEDIGTNEVSKALDKANKVIQKDRVDIIAGVITSGSAYAIANVIKENKVPFVISNAGADDLTQRQANDFIIRPAFVNSMNSHYLGVWAYKQGFRKAVVLGSDFSAGYEHVGGFCRTFTLSGGQIIQEIWPPLGTTDFGPYLANIKRDADVVMVWYSGPDALRFVQQYSEYGLKKKIPLIGSGGLVDEMILDKQGEAAEGIITAWHYNYVLDNPENKEFKPAFFKKLGRKTNLYSEEGYASGQVICEGLKVTKGDAKNGAAFVKAMRNLKIKAPRGLLKFDRFGGPVQTSYIRKVEKVEGEWQNVPLTSTPEISQFWTWSPEEYMKMPPYVAMKGKWAK
jgi:branched-chain amino acid transport system substrate-binding protein